MYGCTDAYLYVVSCGEDACSRTTDKINGLLSKTIFLVPTDAHFYTNHRIFKDNLKL